MIKLIAILGPTASGKTSLGIKLAKEFNGEIISADSRQVYKGLDIGSAKVENIKPKIRSKFQKSNGYCLAEEIPHWLIDVSDYKYKNFTVGQFQKKVDLVIADIAKRGKVPFLVGGSMLYLDAVSKGLGFAPKANLKTRKKLEKLDLDILQQKLKKLDSKAYKYVDLNNKRRVVRALEVAITSGKSFTSFRKEKPKYEFLVLGIKMDRAKLYARIDERVDERMKRGMAKEIKDLLNRGISSKRLQALGLEYEFITKFVMGEIKSKKEAVQLLKGATHAFVRHQETWWRKDKNIIWIYPSATLRMNTDKSQRISIQKQAQKEIEKFLSCHSEPFNNTYK